MEGKRGFVISANGRIVGIGTSAEAAQRYAIWKCTDGEYLGARFRWTTTHKLYVQPLNAEVWTWTGIEIIPASYI